MNQSVAVLFPGQGSQSVGMLFDLALHAPIIQETFAEASQILGYDLWHLCQEGPAETLNQTQYTQPALLTASVAIWRLRNQPEALQPAYLAGHSLGEYTALVCAEALSFEAALHLVILRAQYMQEAVPEGQGAMAAVLGLDDRSIRKVCAAVCAEQPGLFVSPANYNTPGQVVIAGHLIAVLAAAEKAKALGAKRVLPLPVSVPSHCDLMKPAAERLATVLETVSFEPPKIPVIHNADMAIHQSAAAIRAALVAQLYQPVCWVDTVRWILDQGIDHFYECGPGSILCHLNKRIEPRASCVAWSKMEDL